MRPRVTWAPSPPDVIPACDWVGMDGDQLEAALLRDPDIYWRSMRFWAWRPRLILELTTNEGDTP